MDIAYAFDGNYAEPCLVSMYSIIEGLRSEKANIAVTFWLLGDPDVPPTFYDKVRRVIGGRASVEVLTAKPAPMFGTSTHSSVTYVTEAMYLRLYLPALVGRDVKRLLYIDADVLYTGCNLPSLFGLDMSGHPIAAVKDATTRRLADNGGLPLMAEYELDPQSVYFNSGVLLIDVNAWLNNDLTRKCEEYLERSSGERRFPDQDALNAVLGGDWLRLNKRWNHLRSHRLDTYRGNNLDDAELLHLNTTIKPWQPGYPAGYRNSLYTSMVNSVDEANRT